jgi:hypothetical protein
MWASDKTLFKLAQVLHIDAYRLFTPAPVDTETDIHTSKNALLNDLEGKIIKYIQYQFDEAMGEG